MSGPQGGVEKLKHEVADLETILQPTQDSLRSEEAQHRASKNGEHQSLNESAPSAITTSASSLHTLLLLADSALPLGSFAFSAGLESYLAHHRVPVASQQIHLLRTFLPQSLLSLASTSLPYVLAAWRDPRHLEELDDTFDASVICTVARRASTSQGRALLGVWERSFRHTVEVGSSRNDNDDGEGRTTKVQVDAIEELKTFGRAFKSQPMTATSLTASPFECGYVLHAHLGPLWGVVTRALDVDQHNSAYMYLFSHARTVVSAAVRAGVLGPYQAQAELASPNLKQVIENLIQDWWNVLPENAAQVVPIMDMWVGRHEKLYSRIFNS